MKTEESSLVRMSVGYEIESLLENPYNCSILYYKVISINCGGELRL